MASTNQYFTDSYSLQFYVMSLMKYKAILLTSHMLFCHLATVHHFFRQYKPHSAFLTIILPCFFLLWETLTRHTHTVRNHTHRHFDKHTQWRAPLYMWLTSWHLMSEESLSRCSVQRCLETTTNDRQAWGNKINCGRRNNIPAWWEILPPVHLLLLHGSYTQVSFM